MLRSKILTAAAGGGGVEYVGQNYAENVSTPLPTVSLTSLSGGTGTSPSAGDIIVLVMTHILGYNGYDSSALTSSGYTNLVTAYTDYGRDAKITIAYKIATGAETSATVATTGGTAGRWGIRALVFSGVDSATISASSAITTTSNNITPPSITSEGVVISAAATELGNIVSPMPSAWTQSYFDTFVVDRDASTNPTGMHGVGFSLDVAGTATPTAWTCTNGRTFGSCAATITFGE